MTQAGAATRERLIDDLLDVIAELGTDGVSVRVLATRSGVSIGTVQHHFPTRATMLLAALGAVADRAETWLAPSEQSAPADRLRALVGVLIPAGRQAQAGRVWLAFAALAAVDDEVAELYGRYWSRLYEHLAGLFDAAGASAPRASATELLALLDGLTVALVAEPGRVDAAAARAAADRWLDRELADAVDAPAAARLGRGRAPR